MMVKRKANLDDGCNPELVAGAVFDGELEIPVIHAPAEIVIPSGITPFSKREKLLFIFVDFSNVHTCYTDKLEFS